MATGSVNLSDSGMSATHAGLTAIVERRVHSYTGGSHTWSGSWTEDPYLRPMMVTWNSDNMPNVGSIQMEGTRIEGWQTYLNPADQLRVVLKSSETVITDSGTTETNAKNRIIFRGLPAGIVIDASDNTENISVMCMGGRYYMNRIAVYDQWVYGKTSDGASVDFKANRKLVFNEGGRMNRMSSGGFHGTGRHTDDESYLFTYPALDVHTRADNIPNDESAWEGHDFWRVGDAVEYIVNRFADPDSGLTGSLNTDHENFIALNEVRLPELDVDGLSWTEALTRVFAAVGYHWASVPDIDTGDWVVFWWKDGIGRQEYDVQFPNHGTDLADAEAKIDTNRFTVNYDYQNIVNSYIGVGAPGRYEGDWDLNKAWGAASEAQSDEYYYRSGWGGTVNPDWETYKNVFRRWAFDGAGLNTGTPRDFNGFIGTHYEERPRYLDNKALTAETTNEGNRLPAQLFVHHSGTWKRIDGNVNVLGKGLQDGIYIDGTHLKVAGGTEARSLKDIMGNVDVANITGAIEGDLGIDETRSDTTSKEAYMTRQKALRLGDFKYEYRHDDEYGDAEALRDDTTKMQGYLDEKLEATKDPVVSGSVTLPIINYLLTPGTKIGKITGRNITLNSVVVSADMDLQNMDMQLSLADRRLSRFVGAIGSGKQTKTLMA